MPRRDGLNHILLLGSGPIVIGQACEFDYSGVQAAKALKEEGCRVTILNSNPATIMTDPGLADRTYVEPLTPAYAAAVLRREQPDALLATMGGQTALNLAMDLHRAGVLAECGVEMIGVGPEAVDRAEDRGRFKATVLSAGLPVPFSFVAHTMEEALAARNRIGCWPVVVRPAFTLGGAGGGIARDAAAFGDIVMRGLAESPVTEVLVEESLLGWKEIEFEMMRDRRGHGVVVCAIENIDPMGVHTGDSVAVAPTLTLCDREYHTLRDAALAVMNAVGVDGGGANVQFALHPEDGRFVVVEMNPRVSRSSALASKATGYPIAKVATKLALGYTLDELANDVTKKTVAAFEPALDYVVVKVPRFDFEKFPGVDGGLGIQMKAIGETMAIGRTFQEAFQKALRGLEAGRGGFGADGADDAFGRLDDEALARAVTAPTAERLFAVRAALERGWSLERLHELSAITPWFLREMEELVAFANHLACRVGSLESLASDASSFRRAKAMGFSDRQIARLTNTTENAVREYRHRLHIRPTYPLVDTCAGEFASATPYYFSTYADPAPEGACKKPGPALPDAAPESVSGKTPPPGGTVMILGGGPNRIGQGLEFDYCCCHAAYALGEAGFRTIMVNSNPETVSTDYDTADILYFEPLTLEDVLEIQHREKTDGLIVQFGGQTPLNLAGPLAAAGVPIFGTSPDAIACAEDRGRFGGLIDRLGLRQPAHELADRPDAARAAADRVGYPALVRPSFVLGGRDMAIVRDRAELDDYLRRTGNRAAAGMGPILIDRYLENAVEIDADCLSDGTDTVIVGLMEHIEIAGVHSGDSACVLPPAHLSDSVQEALRAEVRALASGLGVCGLMNVQFAVQNGVIHVLEANPRASRTVPFVAKTTGFPLAKAAALCMVGKSLRDLGLPDEPRPKHFAVKEAVFPFNRLPGAAIVLSPEMKSTGEGMGIDRLFGTAYLKSQLAARNGIPRAGRVFISLRNADKPAGIPLATRLASLGFAFCATPGTRQALAAMGVPAQAVAKITGGGHPNVLDLMASDNSIADTGIAWLVDTLDPGAIPLADQSRMRAAAIRCGIPITTTLDGLRAAVEGLEVADRHYGCPDVRSLQEYHSHRCTSKRTLARPETGNALKGSGIPNTEAKHGEWRADHA